MQAFKMSSILRILTSLSAATLFAAAGSAQIDLRQKPPASPPAASATQAITKATAPPSVSNLDSAAIIQKANAYFNSVRTMTADFVQIGADGRQVTGKFYLQKPGRLRFVYDPPSPLEVIADGRSVAVRNRKLAKQDLYFIGQTPLKFLVNNQIDLSRDVRVLEAKADQTQAYVRIEDKATFGGTSRINLYFDPKTFALTRWVVVDPQGYETKVSLAKVDLQAKPDASHFTINYERLDSN